MALNNKIIFQLLFVLVAGCFVMLSCKKDNPEPVEMGYEYFPTEEGKFVTYKVMEVRHDTDLLPTHDTTLYFVKEVIGETFTDEMGDQVQKLYRYSGHHVDSLNTTDVWTIKKTPVNALKVEENIRIIKMAFAPGFDKEWDGNALNNLEEKLYTYSWIDESYTIDDISSESTVYVLHDDFYSFVDYLKGFEIYAKDIGMIHKVEKNFYISNFDTINVIRGEEIEMKAIDFGTE